MELAASAGVTAAGAAAGAHAARSDTRSDAAVANTPASGAVTDAAVRVARLLLEQGPSSVTELARHVSATSVAVGRHLDHLEAAGWVTASDQAPYGPTAVRGLRRRGRPARVWSLTSRGRRALAGDVRVAEHCAVAAVDFVAAECGTDKVDSFAASYTQDALSRWVQAGVSDVEALVDTLTAEGYAATLRTTADGQALQLCQHNCPIGEVAARYPEFCDHETRAFAQILGRNVVRLSTIAKGGHICTTLIPPISQSPVEQASTDVYASTSTTPNEGTAR